MCAGSRANTPYHPLPHINLKYINVAICAFYGVKCDYWGGGIQLLYSAHPKNGDDTWTTAAPHIRPILRFLSISMQNNVEMRIIAVYRVTCDAKQFFFVKSLTLHTGDQKWETAVARIRHIFRFLLISMQNTLRWRYAKSTA